MNIKTVHVCPPIPIRDFDWQAYDADTCDPENDCPVGWGSTEAEAIADLLRQLEDSQ